MSRRDLIIVSALINAGLLVILFASALKSEPTLTELTGTVPTNGVQNQDVHVERQPPAALAGDEVDQVLKEFAARVSPEQTTKSPVEGIEVTPSFAPIAKTQKQPEKKESATSFTDELASHYPEQRSSPPPSISIPSNVVSSSADFVEVRVKKGDFLDRIARQYHTTVQEIMRFNHLTTTNLRIGQLLKVPARKGSMQKRDAPSAGPRYYTVKDGDNPWTIASKNKIKVSDLLRLNHLDEVSARQLKPGDQLKIR